MPRTAITVSTVQPYFGGVTDGVTLVNGDAANDHQIDISANMPRMALLAVCVGGAPESFTIMLPASVRTYNTAISKSVTVPASAAGVHGVQFIPLDDFAILDQGSSIAHVDSTDLSGVYLAVVTWGPPRSP